MDSRKDAHGIELQNFCYNSTIALIRGMTTTLKMDLSLFSTKSLLEVAPDHEVDILLGDSISGRKSSFDSSSGKRWGFDSISGRRQGFINSARKGGKDRGNIEPHRSVFAKGLEVAIQKDFSNIELGFKSRRPGYGERAASSSRPYESLGGLGTQIEGVS